MLVAAVMGLPGLGLAQAPPVEEPLRPPGRPLKPGEYCLDVYNKAPYTILAQVMNAERDRVNLRMQEEEARRVCMKGELYPGDRVYFVLKSFALVPLFDCKTTIKRPIIVKGEHIPDEQGGGTRTWAECY